jgi:hypothetical protein
MSTSSGGRGGDARSEGVTPLTGKLTPKERRCDPTDPDPKERRCDPTDLQQIAPGFSRVGNGVPKLSPRSGRQAARRDETVARYADSK